MEGRLRINQPGGGPARRHSRASIALGVLPTVLILLILLVDPGCAPFRQPAANFWENVVQVTEATKLHYLAFVYAMIVTDEPLFVDLRRTGNPGGHSIAPADSDMRQGSSDVV